MCKEVLKTEKEEEINEFYDYPDRPVPKSERRSAHNIAMVTTGMAVAMSTLYTGALLADLLSYHEAVLAIILGCTVLAIVAGLTGSIGARKGVSFAFLARYPFGRQGSKIVGLVFAISMLGWYSYQCGYFGETMSLLLPNVKLASPKIAAFWGGLLMMTTAVIGFKGMEILSLIAGPALLLMSIYGAITAFNKIGYDVIVNTPPSNPVSLGVGMTVVIGGWITGATLQPDISRYAKDEKSNWIAATIAMIVFAVANWAGVVITKATKAPTVMHGLMRLGLGTVALLIVILGQWTSNDNNLYSGALGIINIKSFSKPKLVAILGIIMTIIGVLGIQEYFVNFLEGLGTFLPPMGTVLIVDYYILKNKDKYIFSENNEQIEYNSWNVIAIISVILAGILSYTIDIGIPAINSFVLSGLLYYILMNIFDFFSLSPYIN